MATERKIGSHVYRCDKQPATEGLALFFRVTKFFRAAPETMASIVSDDKDDHAIRAFLMLALSNDMDAAASHDLLVDLAQMCTTGGDPCVVGVKPAGIEDFVKVAWFAMKVNLRDFLAEGLAEN